jgi:hypothetical protein
MIDEPAEACRPQVRVFATGNGRKPIRSRCAFGGVRPAFHNA